MKKYIIILTSVVVLLGCQKPAESSASAGVDFRIDRLFTHDGCTLYRFKDAGDLRYFSRCDGADSAEVSWHESCGKGCSRQMSVPTARTTDQYNGK